MDDATINSLLSRKEAIEAALSRIEVWLLIFGILVVLGVAGESLFGIRAWWNNRKLQSLQRDIDNERASLARKDSESFRLPSETLQYENLKLQDEILKLRIKMADRHLAAGHVADKLRQFSGQRINLFEYSGDGEIAGIAKDIVEALRSAGWVVSISSGLVPGTGTSGILVEVTAPASPTSLLVAGALVESLRNERLTIEGPKKSTISPGGLFSGEEDPNAQIRITVGKKP